jgi:hypothetical protein
MCTPVTPAVPYLLLGLQDIQWAVGNSRGARKLARTPHVNQKKKKKENGALECQVTPKTMDGFCKKQMLATYTVTIRENPSNYT